MSSPTIQGGELVLAGAVVAAAFSFLRTLLRAMEKSTDRLIRSQEKVAAALADQRVYCANHDDKLVERLAERDAAMYARMDGHHREQMRVLSEIVKSLAANQRPHQEAGQAG